MCLGRYLGFQVARPDGSCVSYNYRAHRAELEMPARVNGNELISTATFPGGEFSQDKRWHQGAIDDSFLYKVLNTITTRSYSGSVN